MRSEAAAVIFLQRAADARRVYAHVVHVRANTDGSKGEGITFPSGAVQRQLLEEVYSHAGVSPLDVSYVEAHGTGTKVSLGPYLGSSHFIVKDFQHNLCSPLPQEGLLLSLSVKFRLEGQCMMEMSTKALCTLSNP